MANSNYDPEKGVERIEKAIAAAATQEAELTASSVWKEAEINTRRLNDIRGYAFGQDIAYFLSKLSKDYWLHCTGTFFYAAYISRGGVMARVPDALINYLGIWEMFATNYINTTNWGYWDIYDEWVERTKLIPVKTIQNGLYYKPNTSKFELLSPAQSELAKENRFINVHGNWTPGTIIHIYSSLWDFDKYNSKNKLVAHLGSRHYNDCNEGTFGELVTVADAALAVATGFKVKKIIRYPEFIPGGKW